MADNLKLCLAWRLVLCEWNMNSKKEKQLRQVLADVGIKNQEWWLSEADTYNAPMAEIALFLREVWRSVVRKGDTSWITETIKNLKERETRNDLYALRFLPDNPELKEALQRVSRAGVDLSDLTTIVRELQLETLSHTIDLLDGGHCFRDGLEGNWSVCSLDGDLEPAQSFGEMKNLMWDFDPDREST